jgi:hypothetical protein
MDEKQLIVHVRRRMILLHGLRLRIQPLKNLKSVALWHVREDIATLDQSRA